MIGQRNNRAGLAECEVRSTACHIKGTSFPAYRDLAEFDFASGEVNEAMVHPLYHGDFIDGAIIVVLIARQGQ